MNRRQLAYQIGRVVNNCYDAVSLYLAFGLGNDSIGYFANSQGLDENVTAGVTDASASLFFSFYALLGATARCVLHTDRKQIRGDPEKFPLEYSEEVVIDDTTGLHSLLSETAKGRNREWGTFIRSYDDNGRAVVEEILDCRRAEEGLVGLATSRIVFLRNDKAQEQGYNGCHHYHPSRGLKWFGARNYAVNLVDRVNRKNWMSLLTFNLPEGPEIIGFNKRYTYIPTDTTKRRLVRATPRQIMEYLA